MTRTEFEEMEGLIVIFMLDGRMGLCPHWNDRGVLADVFSQTNNTPEQILILWQNVARLDGAALREVNN
jgi:hypothetical protein